MNGVVVNVLQSQPGFLRYSHVESFLPDRADAQIVAYASLELLDYRRNGLWWRDTEQNMAMVGHHDETEQEERVKLLYAIERFDGLPGKGRIFKDGFTELYVRRNQHDCFILCDVISGASHDGCNNVLSWSGKMPDQCQARMPGLKQKNLT